jgi:aspartate carbamoyltransferase regulatory subunit
MPEPITASNSRVRQVEAIANGTVIDHIPAETTLRVAALVSAGGDQVFIGNNLRSTRLGRKGVVKISGRELGPRQFAGLALLAPSASVSVIRDYVVVSKSQVTVPDRFDGIARCANPNCITNHEQWTTRFQVVCSNPLTVRCCYCERSFDTGELNLL